MHLLTVQPHSLLLLLTALLIGGCSEPPPPAGPQLPVPVPEEVATPEAPEAIGPYSQGILAGHTLYLAGQIALDPESGEMAEGGIEAETHQVMENLQAVLHAAGMDFSDVVQAQVFLVDLEEFGAMNEIYGDYLSEPFPARATVQVAALPRGARVEIQMVAVGGAERD
jgi:2-iminobutanoate/2-iminopropanoate deaminase